MTAPGIVFLILGFVSITTSSYLDHVPLHHQTSYHALLKQARSRQQIAAQFKAPMNKQGCQQTCTKIGQFWARNCFSTGNPLCSNLNDEKKNQQFKCISGCLSSSPPLPTPPQPQPSAKVPIGQPSINAKAEQKISSNRHSFLEEDTETISSLPPRLATLEELNLTSGDKCRIEGLEDSLACELEHEDPVEADRVFKEVFPKLLTRYQGINEERPTEEQLTENPGKPQTPETNNEYLSPARRQDQNRKHVRGERSIDTIHQRSINDNRRKRTVADSYDQEICQTKYQISMPFHAQHFYTGERVSMYFHRSRNGSSRYVQLFQVGTCKSAIPVINIGSSSARPQCKVTKMKVLADIVINLNSVDRTKFRGCVDIDPNHALCRDWVVMPNACKLYLPG